MKGSNDQLSRIDKNILSIMQEDGRITYAGLNRQCLSYPRFKNVI